MAKAKTKSMAFAGLSALATKLLEERFGKSKPKPKPKRMRKVVKIAFPSLLALGAGGTLINKIRKGGGAGKGRNFSLVGGAGPAPSTNSQSRPETSATPPAPETSSNKK